MGIRKKNKKNPQPLSSDKDLFGVMMEYQAFKAFPEMRLESISYFNDRMNRIYANLLANYGEDIYVSKWDDELLLTVQDGLEKDEIATAKPLSEEEIYNVLKNGRV